MCGSSGADLSFLRVHWKRSLSKFVLRIIHVLLRVRLKSDGEDTHRAQGRSQGSGVKATDDGDVADFVMESGGDDEKKKMKRPTEGPVEVSLHMVSDDSTLFKFAGVAMPLVQAKYVRIQTD